MVEQTPTSEEQTKFSLLYIVEQNQTMVVEQNHTILVEQTNVTRYYNSIVHYDTLFPVLKERHVWKESNGSTLGLCVVPKESHDSTLIKEVTPKESHD